MNIDKITPCVHYAGVNDRTSALFESLWPLPNGVSYNSYIVKGEDKIALVDGTHLAFTERLIDHLLEITGGVAPDYLVVNHMEPDHSGAIALLRRAFPSLRIVGNGKTADMLQGYYSVPDDDMVIVKDGDILPLGGGVDLKFVLTPMVHWPETMMTWLECDGVIFTGDAFGCFGALSGAVVDCDMNVDGYFLEMHRYYSNIVAKYGSFVQKALAKVAGLDIRYVCSTHGPVWHADAERVVSLYDRMSRWEPLDGGTLIVYGSMYGNTERLCERFAACLAASGERNIKMCNVATVPLSFLLADVMRFRGVVIASPTYNNEIFPPVETFLRALVQRGMKNRVVATLGSFTWAPQALKKMNALLDAGGIPVIDAKVEMRQSLSPSLDTQLAAFADAYLAALR